MARKPRSQRPRPTGTTPGSTQLLEHDEEGVGPRTAATAAVAAPQRQRPSHAVLASRQIDYTYVNHDVIRIAIITVVLVGGMFGLSMVMQ